MLRTFKFVSGDEIVGEMEEENKRGTHIRIINPLYARLGFDAITNKNYLYFEVVCWLSPTNEILIPRSTLAFEPLDVKPEVETLYHKHLKHENSTESVEESDPKETKEMHSAIVARLALPKTSIH